LGGQVVSATTDGFITDINDLEYKILSSQLTCTLLKEYRVIRNELSGDASSLELKSSGKGIIS
jgi:hypothetical protein